MVMLVHLGAAHSREQICTPLSEDGQWLDHWAAGRLAELGVAKRRQGPSPWRADWRSSPALRRVTMAGLLLGLVLLCFGYAYA